MEKSTFEQMGGTYRQEGDYFLPNLTVPESVPAGIWGQRRRQYLQKHRKAFYNALLLSGKLDTHLAEIDLQAEETFSQEGITEQLKANNQMRWVGLMNICKTQAEEIVYTELIYS